jgi:hypothetical protein
VCRGCSIYYGSFAFTTSMVFFCFRRFVDIIIILRPPPFFRKYIYTYRQIRTGEKDNGIEPLDAIPIHGYINGIAMGPGGRFCVAAVGQEPRMGRWDRVPRAKNRFAIIRLHDDVDESKK